MEHDDLGMGRPPTSWDRPWVRAVIDIGNDRPTVGRAKENQFVEFLQWAARSARHDLADNAATRFGKNRENPAHDGNSEFTIGPGQHASSQPRGSWFKPRRWLSVVRLFAVESVDLEKQTPASHP
jgi:hypothetical protein